MDKTMSDRRTAAWDHLTDTVCKTVLQQFRESGIDEAEFRFYALNAGSIPTEVSVILSKIIATHVLPMFSMISIGNMIDCLDELLLSCIQNQFIESNVNVLIDDIIMCAVQKALNAFALRGLRKTYLDTICQRVCG